MEEKKAIEFKVIRKNKYGHRYILEPKERITFREKCRHNSHGVLCAKHYSCLTEDGMLFGCTSDVSCPRLLAWDKRHGLEKPYTMVENKFPDLRPTTFTWHPSIESPGRKMILMAFIEKGRDTEHFVFNVGRFGSRDVIPASCRFHGEDGTRRLAVAWAYYDEITKGITEGMVKDAESYASLWWNKEE